VIDASGPTRITRILAPTDFSPASRAATRRAADLAADLGAALSLLHVLALPNEMIGIVPGATVGEELGNTRARAKRELVAMQVELERRGAGEVDVVVDEAGSYVDAIVAHARTGRFDLIVMATHGRSAIGRLLLGSVAEGVLRGATCPVLMVPTRG
jgi:nucleotide-binding universal stress UspA family protein